MRFQASTPVHTPASGALAFPLGGIGTGNFFIGARGNFRDWEVANRPAKGTLVPHNFFVLRAKPEGENPVMRVVEGRVPPPYDLSHGFDPSSGSGLPHFARSTFRGEYPFGGWEFSDDAVPVRVELEAYTPLIPLNPDDSGIPVAILTYTLTNVTDKPVDVTLVGSMQNPVGQPIFNPIDDKRDFFMGKTVNEYREGDGLKGIVMSAAGIAPDALEYGNLALVTDYPDVTYKRCWKRGMWWDNLREFWDDVAEDGRLTDFGYTDTADYPDTGSLGVYSTLPPQGTATFRFMLTWYFPTRMNSWDIKPEKRIRNHYATCFSSAWDAAAYVEREINRLDSETRAFHDALFNSTLPPEVLETLANTIVPLRSNTCFWLEDGRFYGWEGCQNAAGSCPGNCTHVWSYAQTVAFLFPSLEREMRQIEFTIETDDTGYMSFRGMKTFGESWDWRGEKIAAVDGQMGSILRVYREYKLAGDKNWLAQMWPGVKRAIDFAPKQWDTDGDGVLDGRQHNTYDIELFGPNPLCSFYYLAALRSVEEMARVMNEPELAAHYRALYERSSQRADELMWNGDYGYFIQKSDDVDAHPYQHGIGCLSDQLLGALHARLLGLGDILPPEHVHSAIKAIFDNNFKHDFSEHVNVQRTFILNDETGLLLCTFPHGGRPRFPFVYSEEVWTGIEYHVATHLMYEGFVDEGLQIVRAVRERHDGIRRSPFNEVECGHHYARSMAAWGILIALSGFQANVADGVMSFAPIQDVSTEDGIFQTFWSTGTAWGIYRQHYDPAAQTWTPSVAVLGGDASGMTVQACGQTITI